MELCNGSLGFIILFYFHTCLKFSDLVLTLVLRAGFLLPLEWELTVGMRKRKEALLLDPAMQIPSVDRSSSLPPPQAG